MEDFFGGFMKIKPGHLYHIKNSFFDYLEDCNLMINKENNNYRPNYCALQDLKTPKIYWMIPLSSRIEKYEKIVNHKIKKYGKCNSIIIGLISNKKAVFLIQNSFPIISEYINHEHTINNVAAKLSPELSYVLYNNLQDLFAMKRKGINLFYTNIDAIYAKLINQIELTNDKMSIVEKIEKIQNKQSQELNKLERQVNSKNNLEK